MPKTRSQIASKKHSRNAFMHFLSAYRKYKEQADGSCKMSATELSKEAACVWKRLPLYDKYLYIEAARNAKYNYKCRNRNANKILIHIRNSMKNRGNQVDLVELSLAVKQMQLWKRTLLRSICSGADQNP